MAAVVSIVFGVCLINEVCHRIQPNKSKLNSGYQAHVPITLNGKKYALNKQVSNYVVMTFSNNTSILSFVLTGYEFMLPCMCFLHLTFILDHSMPDYSMPDYSRHGRIQCCMVLKSHVKGSGFVL